MADLGRMEKMWFVKAADDLRVAKLLIELPEKHMDSSVFHSQQAAEKAIKGYLTAKRIRFDKIHDIEKLLKLVAKVDSELSIQLQPATVLTMYAVAYRYPEEAEPPESLNPQTCEKVYVLANWVYQEMFSQCAAK